MGILNVDNLRGVGSGTSVTCLSNRLETTNINASGIITATSFTIDDWIVHAGDTNTKFGFPDADIFTIETNGAERLRIKSDGSVGIGTATPSAELDVYGNGTVAQFRGTGGSCFIGLTDEDAGAGIGFIGSDNGALLFQTAGSGYSTKLNIASDGKISAGTVQTTHTLGITGGSSSQLLVKGTEADIWMESTGPSGVWRILGSTGTNTHRFRIYDNTNGKEPFYIEGSSGSNTQHVHVNSGNLVFDAHGTGINFAANTNDETGAGSISANGEIFDDYEEGSWTPVANGAGTINGSSITYAGWYTKVGRVVHLEFYANNSAGDIEIPSYKIFSGLPFATGSGNYGTGRIMTEDGEQLARQGDIIIGGSTFLINKCGSSSGTVRLGGTVTYIAT